MGLETGEGIKNLDPANPLETDSVGEGNEHLHLVKKALIKDGVRFATLAEAVAFDKAVEGGKAELDERTTGNGGGAMWDYVDITSVTPNSYWIVAHNTLPLALQLRISNNLYDVAAFGSIQDNSTDNTAVVQATIDAIATLDEDLGGIISIPRFCNFNLKNLAFTKRQNLAFFVGDDISATPSSRLNTNELVTFAANANNGGIVNEERLTAPFHPGIIVDVRKDVSGHDTYLGAGQTMNNPARASYNIMDEQIDVFRTVYQSYTERTPFNGTALHAWIQRVTLTGITTSSFTITPVAGDRIIGVNSGAVGLVVSIDGTETVLSWREGVFEVGEKVVNNRGTVAAPANETSSTAVINQTRDTLTSNSLTVDVLNGYWGVGLPPEAAGSHFTVGGRTAVVKSRPGGQHSTETITDPSRAWVDSYENTTPDGLEVVLDTTKTINRRRLVLRRLGETNNIGAVGLTFASTSFSSTLLTSTTNYNVSGNPVRNSLGDYTIIFDSAAKRSDYTVAIANSNIADNTRYYIKTPTALRIRNYDSAGNLADLTGAVDLTLTCGDF